MSSDAPMPERTHPLLWLIGLLAIIALVVTWFSHWFDTGRAHGRSLGRRLNKAEAAGTH